MSGLSKLSCLQLAMVGALGAIFGVSQAEASEPQRVLSLGGSVTEIIYALGEGDRLVARDVTSNFPAEAEALPSVGYIRGLSPEGVLSVAPDLIIAEEGAGPTEVVELLKAANVEIVWVPVEFSAEAVSTKIDIVAGALGADARGAELVQKVEAEIAAARASVSHATPPRVLFVFSLAGGRIMAAGDNTGADSIITLAGGQNALSGFEGYKQVSDEAVSISEADVILMMDSEGDRAISDDDLFAHPAIAVTPAGQNRAAVRMDGMKMLGFSVRTAEAVRELSDALAVSGE